MWASLASAVLGLLAAGCQLPQCSSSQRCEQPQCSTSQPPKPRWARTATAVLPGTLRYRDGAAAAARAAASAEAAQEVVLIGEPADEPVLRGNVRAMTRGVN